MYDYPGFVFWGLFLVFGIIVVLYYFWMKKADKKEHSNKS